MGPSTIAEKCPERTLVFTVEHLRALEAAETALVGDIRAVRLSILKGPEMLPRDAETLANHFRGTRVLLITATQSYEEMILALTPGSTTGAEPQGDDDPRSQSGVLEPRRAPRLAFGGVAEILSDAPKAHIVGPIVDLNRFGCLVRTEQFLPVRTRVKVRITHEGDECAIGGEVVHVTDQAIGIGFDLTAPGDAARLDEWLEHK